MIHTVGGQGWEAAYAPPPSQQLGKAPSNLSRAHSKGSANVTEQMSHWGTMLAAPATSNKTACSKAFVSQGLVFGDMFTEILPALLSLVTKPKHLWAGILIMSGIGVGKKTQRCEEMIAWMKE